MKLTLATCPSVGLFFDDEPLEDALAARGVKVQVRPWQDIDPGETPVLIRTVWDYTEHREAFMAWLEDMAAVGTPVINPVPLMKWNLDKSYLLELEAKGHAIVPTQIISSFDEATVQEIRRARGWNAAVAKPTVGASATGLVVVGDEGIRTFDVTGNTWAPDAAALPLGPCLVQPLLPQIEDGEWSLFYFGGQFSHAVVKRPADGDIRVQEEHGGTTVAAEPTPAILGAADAITADVPEAAYARVDGVVVDGRFLLMELELVEPELYFRYAPDGVARFADHIAGMLTRSAASL